MPGGTLAGACPCRGGFRNPPLRAARDPAQLSHPSVSLLVLTCSCPSPSCGGAVSLFAPHMWKMVCSDHPLSPLYTFACAKHAQVIDSLLIVASGSQRHLHMWGCLCQQRADSRGNSRLRQRTIRGESELWTTTPVVHRGSLYLRRGRSAPCGNLVGNTWGVRRAHQLHIPGERLGATLNEQPRPLIDISTGSTTMTTYIIERLLMIPFSWGSASTITRRDNRAPARPG